MHIETKIHKSTVEIKKSNKEEIHKAIEDYYKNIIAPNDDMWEKAIIGVADYYKIMINGEIVGYFCLDKDNILLQYFIRDEFISKSKELFKYILEKHNIQKGFVGTNDIRSLPLFLDFNKEVCTHTYLYSDISVVNIECPIKEMKLLIAAEGDLHRVLEYHSKCLHEEGDWLKPYCTELISKGGLILFMKRNEIIGSGEIRLDEKHEKYAHLGVTVHKEYRRKGLASFILSHLKEECYVNKKIPICSTTIENIGSQKAIENAALFAYHRILEVKF